MGVDRRSAGMILSSEQQKELSIGHSVMPVKAGIQCLSGFRLPPE